MAAEGRLEYDLKSSATRTRVRYEISIVVGGPGKLYDKVSTQSLKVHFRFDKISGTKICFVNKVLGPHRLYDIAIVVAIAF